MFGLTSKDAENLSLGLKICKKLRVLKIHNSKLDDDRFYAIFDGIKALSKIGKYSIYNYT